MATSQHTSIRLPRIPTRLLCLDLILTQSMHVHQPCLGVVCLLTRRRHIGEGTQEHTHHNCKKHGRCLCIRKVCFVFTEISRWTGKLAAKINFEKSVAKPKPSHELLLEVCSHSAQ